MAATRGAPAVAMRTGAFNAACVISFILNAALNWVAVHAQFTGYFRKPLLHYLPFWGSVKVAGMAVSLSTDLFITALVVAWLTAYLGGIQPAKDASRGAIPRVHPLYLRYGAWWFFPELRRRSLCARASILALHFAVLWALLEYALFALLAYLVLPEPRIPVFTYQFAKSALAGTEGVVVTALTFVAAAAHARRRPDDAAAPLVASADADDPEDAPAQYAALPKRAVVPFAAAIHGQDAAARVRRPEAMAEGEARARAEAERRAAQLDREARTRSEEAAAALLRDTAGGARHSGLRVAILTVGTRGDVQPFVGLAQALQRAGHRPVICTTRDFAAFVRENGVEYADGIVPTIEQPDAWLTADTIAEMFLATAALFEEYYPNMGRAFHRACTEPECDVIVATAMTISLGLDLGEALRKPVWACKLAPDIPTRAFPPPGMQASSLAVGNLCKHYVYWGRVAGAAGRSNLTELENAFRRDVLGLGPFAGMQRLGDLNRTPYILGVSPTLMPKPRDWPASASVAGFWFMDAKPGYRLPDHVGAFLDAGPPPVCVTFGSMMLVRRGQFMQWVLRALEELDQRVILITGWADPPSDLPRSVLCVDGLPHEHIFPRCRAVVYHGGAGTTGRVLEAGVPSVVIPILRWTDQPLFGQLAAQLGCGACVLQTSYEAIRAAIAFALDPEGQVMVTARQVGSRIRAERDAAFAHVAKRLESDPRIRA